MLLVDGALRQTDIAHPAYGTVSQLGFLIANGLGTAAGAQAGSGLRAGTLIFCAPLFMVGAIDKITGTVTLQNFLDCAKVIRDYSGPQFLPHFTGFGVHRCLAYCKEPSCRLPRTALANRRAPAANPTSGVQLELGSTSNCCVGFHPTAVTPLHVAIAPRKFVRGELHPQTHWWLRASWPYPARSRGVVAAFVPGWVGALP